MSVMEKDYNEFKLHSNKQSVEDILIERAETSTIQIVCENISIDNYDNAEYVLEGNLFTEVEQRRRPSLE